MMTDHLWSRLDQPGRSDRTRPVEDLRRHPQERARRALKRRLTNILYRHIIKDQQRRPNTTT
jgi:hypothetical protein